MYINLRKANALQEAIQQAMPTIATSVDLSIYEANLSEVLESERATLLEMLEVRFDLLDALYTIRSLVARANHESGINELVNGRAKIEKGLAVYAALTGGWQESLSVIQGKAERLLNSTSEYASQHVNVNLLTESDVVSMAEAVAALKRSKVEIQDALLEKNIATQIVLPENVVAILRRSKII